MLILDLYIHLSAQLNQLLLAFRKLNMDANASAVFFTFPRNALETELFLDDDDGDTATGLLLPMTLSSNSIPLFSIHSFCSVALIPLTSIIRCKSSAVPCGLCVCVCVCMRVYVRESKGES